MNNFIVRTVSSIFLVMIGIAVLYSEVVKDVFAIALLLGGVFELYNLRPINLYVVAYALMLGCSVFFITQTDHSSVFMFWLVAWIHDTGGYIFGKLLKDPKIIPSISPNKTWFGFLGGYIMLIGASILFDYTKGYPVYYIHTILTVLFLNTICFFGDVIESRLKRMYGVKESGALIPGHGGVLDRFDAFFFLIFCFGVYDLVLRKIISKL